MILQAKKQEAIKDTIRCRKPAMGAMYSNLNTAVGSRSCPKCHKSNIHALLQGRQKELLPVPYYHVIFTLPHVLRAFARRKSHIRDMQM
ncbi:MAG: transposase zinc-binding domain-containing protein [Planctomycetota bacterium]|jgi:hypothetical protein